MTPSQLVLAASAINDWAHIQQSRCQSDSSLAADIREFVDDVFEVSQAYLAANDADDDLPITRDWLLTVGFIGDGEVMKLVSHRGRILITARFYPNGTSSWQVGWGQTYLDNPLLPNNRSEAMWLINKITSYEEGAHRAQEEATVRQTAQTVFQGIQPDPPF